MSQNDTPSDGKNPEPHLDEEHLGLAGRTARFFIQSPLSPLLYMSMLLMGLMGLVMTPRQEDPQISVPMVDIFVKYPGASADEVSLLAIQPLERIMSEIKGVKHVYSASERGQGIVTIEFQVGEEMGPSLVKVNEKLDSNMDKIPPGVMPPLVKAKGIDDVPVVNLTLWSKDLDRDGVPDVDDGQLRMLGLDLLQALKEIPNTGGGFVVGGRREQVRVEVFPEQLSGYQISLDQVANAIRTANSEQQAGGVEAGDTHFTVMTGAFLRNEDDIKRLVVGTFNNSPVYVRDVARVVRGPEDAKHIVSFYTGPAAESEEKAVGAPAVTIAIAKKKGANGVTVANEIIKRAQELKDKRIPSNVEVAVTRNYGETANDKVNELIFKLFVATGFVFLLVLGAFRAFRPAIVVVLVIPVVLLFTIFIAWLTGYTIDRVSLFALIFSIGILVDDAIVVVENIYRRWLEEEKTDAETAIDAVREVGNPTILATFTVIAALMPMGFVTGMMGPYMGPIPALGSVAMLVSLFSAFVFTPYLAISPWLRPSMRYLEKAGKREHAGAERLEGLFRRVLNPLIDSRAKRFLFRLMMWGTFAFTCSFFYTKWVAVKMLPLDNKPEFSVVLDMPEGTALPVTANMAHIIAEKLRTLPEVTALQVYAGAAKPFDFNGMVRHYYLRNQPWQGEVQVQLLHKSKRKRTSHEIAVQARQEVDELIKGTGAHVAVVEMPPGPPVLQSVVAEVHGPNAELRRQVTRDLTEIFSRAESLRDVDNYLRDPFEYWRFNVETEKAVRQGISVDAINRNLAMALGGTTLGDIKQRAGHEPVNIVIQVPLAQRSEIARLGDLPVHSRTGATLPLSELGHFEKVPEDDIIYHKDLRDVEYVVADVGGRLAAPVYGMLQVEDLLKDYKTPAGTPLETSWIGPPASDDTPAIEWAGEWTVTYETFRDMGAAFMVALVLIYILVVWEFGNFRIPALIMAPIPLTLLGIIPMHAIMGAAFTATSMIGWIALAGIIVRNSILLVDFSVHEVQKGVPVRDAVIRACKARTRPIMITALALVCGSSVIFTDPIFQGMAISLASGVLVSTVLTLIVIPLGCIAASEALCEVAAAGMPEGAVIPCEGAFEEPSEVAAQAAPVPPKRSVAIAIWSKFITVLQMLFYLVRAPFVIIASLLSRRKRTAKVSTSDTSSSTVDASGSDGGAVPPAGSAPPVSSPGGVLEPEPEVAAKAMVGETAVEMKPVEEAVGAEKSAGDKAMSVKPAKTAKAGVKKKTALEQDVRVKKTKTGKKSGPKTVSARKKPASEETTQGKEPAKSSSPKKARGSTKKRVGKQRPVSRKKAKATAKRATSEEPHDTAGKGAPTGTEKGTGRRGIRLKAVSGRNDSGLE